MPEIFINGVAVEAREGATVLETALEHGFYIPYVCWHKHLSVAGNCRLCMVEVEAESGGWMDIACNMPVTAGMRVLTKSEKIKTLNQDTMQFITSDIATFCVGRAYSGGAVLLAAGHPGKRTILPHAKVMIHQPLGGVTGQTTDIQIQAEHITKMKRTLNEILARHCGQTVERIAKDVERDKFFSADEAKAYGLVDEVAMFPDKLKK